MAVSFQLFPNDVRHGPPQSSRVDRDAGGEGVVTRIEEQ